MSTHKRQPHACMSLRPAAPVFAVLGMQAALLPCLAPSGLPFPYRATWGTSLDGTAYWLVRPQLANGRCLSGHPLTFLVTLAPTTRSAYIANVDYVQMRMRQLTGVACKLWIFKRLPYDCPGEPKTKTYLDNCPSCLNTVL
jgi:hypothetical protein